MKAPIFHQQFEMKIPVFFFKNVLYYLSAQHTVPKAVNNQKL